MIILRKVLGAKIIIGLEVKVEEKSSDVSTIRFEGSEGSGMVSRVGPLEAQLIRSIGVGALDTIPEGNEVEYDVSQGGFPVNSK